MLTPEIAIHIWIISNTWVSPATRITCDAKANAMTFNATATNDVNKDWTCKDKDKDQAYKDQDKDND